MMFASLWHVLLDVDSLPSGWESGHLGWERGLPGWGWALFIFAAGFFAVWSYHGLVGRRSARGVLAGLRFALIFFVGVLIAGPAIIVNRDLVERDWVVYLVDRSASMQVPDVAQSAGPRISREGQLARTLENGSEVFAQIDTDHDVLWLGFDSGAFDLAESDESPHDLGSPDGLRTDLAGALEQGFARVSGRPVSGIVVFSDGRSATATGPSMLRNLINSGVRVYPVPLGSESAVGDFAIADIESPQFAFVHDLVPIEVDIDRLGSLDEEAVEVLIRDEATGTVLDRRPVDPSEGDRAVLLVKGSKPGRAQWRVEIVSRNDDLVEDNNSQLIEVELVDRPLRVLYVEGRPRWEYHFLKTVLVREPTIDSSIMLLSADRDFAQEGTTPIARLPNSPAEWEPFDVIVLGDIHANFFSIAQQEMILQHVRERGAGVLLMAGERHNPLDYGKDTRLGALSPVRDGGTLGAIDEPIVLEPTDAARRLSVLQIMLGGEDAWPILSDPSREWTTLRWGWRLDPRQLKGAVEVLATGVNPDDRAGSGVPMVTSMRYGAGQAAFVATDEIWRWRFSLGETLPEQFWIQITRMLSRDRLSLSGRSAVVQVNPRRADVGEVVVVELRLLDSSLVERGLREIPVEVIDRTDGSSVALTLTAQGGSDRFEATFLADRAGGYDIRVDDPTLRGQGLSGAFEVVQRNDELRHPSADHANLVRLAQTTGGLVVEPDNLEALTSPDGLRNREIRTPIDLVEPLWDTPLALIVVLFLLTAEWIGRKLLRLI